MKIAFLLEITLLATPALAQSTTPDSDGPPLLVVLAPTGIERDHLPVLTHHPDGAAYEALLRSGFSGRLLRLYRCEQQLRAVRDGTSIEPAYLLLSRQEGGFPRSGFWLDDVRKDGVGFVDLHEGLARSGRFGAMDQIFPHELMHVILHQLAGPVTPGVAGANQVHAIGVRTDRVTAFDEGFAEHAQVMAIDALDALPGTAALAAAPGPPAVATAKLQAYRRALEARWSLAPPSRLAFLLWFSQTEQVLRYHAVKSDLFAHEPDVPDRVMTAGDGYSAYLLENVLPGTLETPLKSTSRRLATEGAIAALSVRWVTQSGLQRTAESPAFYARFGLADDDLDPLDHAYLKWLAVLADHRPRDLAAFVRGYLTSFPSEAGAVEELMRRAGYDWPLAPPPEIWLANDGFMTGTTVFDQYRALPRVHTFDLNAASHVELLTVEGVTKELAAEILRHAPYDSLGGLQRVSGLSPDLFARFQAMHDGMKAVREENRRTDIERFAFTRLLAPTLMCAAGLTLLCAAVGGVLFGFLWPVSRWRLLVNGLAAAMFSLWPAWVFGASLQIGDRMVGTAAFALIPVLAFGLPAACWSLIRSRSLLAAGRSLAAWIVASMPAVFVLVPIG